MYSGEFSEGKYQGSGELFASNGALIYQGDFASGVYSGTGILYQEDGSVYRGGFQGGVKSGEGSIYKMDTVLAKGTFENDRLKDGSGKFYGEQGILEYDGQVTDFQYGGSGTLYYPTGAFRAMK